MATLDHLYDKFHPNRAYVESRGETRTVLSCKKCNNERSNNNEIRKIPIEELHERSKRHPKKIVFIKMDQEKERRINKKEGTSMVTNGLENRDV